MTGRRRLAAWLAVFALVFQAALPLALSSQARAANDGAVGLASFCGIEILQGDQDAGAGGESSHDDPSCPICRVLCNVVPQQGGFLPSTGATVHLPILVAAASVLPADLALPPVRVAPSARQRAPPSPS